MAENVDVNAKWDACLDLTLRRFVYSSLAGAFGGLLLFRSPVTRWASIAFAAGVGVGSAYAECSLIFDGSPAKLPPSKAPNTPPPQDVLKQNSPLYYSILRGGIGDTCTFFGSCQPEACLGTFYNMDGLDGRPSLGYSFRCGTGRLGGILSHIP